MKYLLDGQETERLRFRLLKEDDFDTWIDLFKAKNAALFLGLNPQLSEIELCKMWFNKIFNRYVNDLGGLNVLIDKDSNNFIGQCGLLVQTVEGKERLEIGYSILPQYWGRGYASEASQKCKDYAFENNFSDSLISMVHIDNIASEKVAKRNGMTLEKFIADCEGMPANIFSIEKSDWKQNKET